MSAFILWACVCPTPWDLCKSTTFIFFLVCVSHAVGLMQIISFYFLCPTPPLSRGISLETAVILWPPLSRGWISLETAVILWPPLSRGWISLETAVMVQIMANYHPTKLIYINHFHYLLHTPFFFYFLCYPFFVLHLNVAIIGCLRMRFTNFHL